MKTTSGSLSLLSATNLWCFGDKHGGGRYARCWGRQIAPPHFPQLPNPVVKAARGSLTPEPGPHPRPLIIADGSLTRDIQRPSP